MIMMMMKVMMMMIYYPLMVLHVPYAPYNNSEIVNSFFRLYREALLLSYSKHLTGGCSEGLGAVIILFKDIPNARERRHDNSAYRQFKKHLFCLRVQVLWAYIGPLPKLS